MDHINDLPPELLVKIFTLFIKSEGHKSFFKNVANVCKYWENLSSSGLLWKDVSADCFEAKDLHDLLELGEKDLLVSTKSLRIDGCMHERNPWIFDLSGVFVHCPNLRELQLHCIGLSPVSLEDLIFPHLESLTFSSIRFEVEKKLIDPRVHPTELLIPAVIACGKNLKRLTVIDIVILDVLYSGEHHEQGLVSKIAQCCHSLEEFVFSDYYERPRYTFPLLEVGTSCHKLRELKVFGCGMTFPKDESCRSFVQLKSFEALFCDFEHQNLHKILKYSETLEKLKIAHCEDIRLSDMSLIPSDKLEIIELENWSLESSKFLEDAVAKWKYTLKEIRLCELRIDVTNVLQILLHRNSHPVIESLCLTNTAVSEQFLTLFIRACENLKNLSLEPYGTGGQVPIFLPHNYPYHPYQRGFPVEELEVNCHRLRALKLSGVEMVFSSIKKNYEFRGMESFEIASCDFHGVDLNTLLSCSANLKMLSINDCKNLVLSDMSMIPSDKLKILRIDNMDLGSDLKFLEDAVGKWKGSLEEIRLCILRRDVTSVLKSFLYENPNPILELLLLDYTLVSTSFMATFVQRCKKLNYVRFMPYGLGNNLGSKSFWKRIGVEKIMKIQSTKTRPTYDP